MPNSKVKTKAEAFICDFCGQVEKGKGYLERHIDRKHSKFVCNVCNQIYSQRANILNHLKTHFQRFVCQYCGLEIHHEEKFVKHIYLKHEPNNKDLILSVQSRESYKCRFCVRSFPSAVHRNAHEGIVHKNRKDIAFKCKECQLICNTKEQLRSHSFEHYSGTLHFCAFPDCDRFFRELKHLKDHEKIHGPARYQCEKCNQKFSQSSNFCKHKKRCKGKPKEKEKISKQEQERIASVAEEQFLLLGGKLKRQKAKTEENVKAKRRLKSKLMPEVQEEIVEEHLEEEEKEKNYEDFNVETKIEDQKLVTETENHLKSEIPSNSLDEPSINPPTVNFQLICDECGFLTNLTSELRAHLKNHSLNKTLSCSECDLRFKRKTELNRHLRFVHSISRRKKRLKSEFICDYCGAKITKLSYLYRHIKQHLKPTDECTICNLKLRNLAKHMKLVHSTDRPFICATCGVGFKARNNLNNHMMTHDEPTECPICHKFLPNMKRHLKCHSRPLKLFNCPQCTKTCTTKQAVQEHIRRIHEKTPLGKSYTCLVCNLNFIRNSDLRRHSYIHYTGRIYACQFPGCTEMFKKSFKLHCHMMIHNPSGVSFQCEFCDRKYLRKPTLKKHKRLAHPDQENK